MDPVHRTKAAATAVSHMLVQDVVQSLAQEENIFRLCFRFSLQHSRTKCKTSSFRSRRKLPLAKDKLWTQTIRNTMFETQVNFSSNHNFEEPIPCINGNSFGWEVGIQTVEQHISPVLKELCF